MNDASDNLIDQRLKDAFTPPPAEHYANVARGVSRPVRPLWGWMMASAAALLVVVFILDKRSAVAGPSGPEGHDAAQLGALWVAAYDDALDKGFDTGLGTGGCCQSRTDVSATSQEMCGQPLAFGECENMQMLGRYDGLSTGGCLGLLLRVRGDPVSVFVVSRDHDPRPVLRDRDELMLRRRELGSLVLYSIASHDPVDALAGFSQ